MKPAEQGFTLIEVMVAMLLMAIVSLIAWRGLDSVTRADTHLKASSEQSLDLLRALNQLERDVAMRASVELREPQLGSSDTPPDPAPAALTVRSSDTKGFTLEVIRSAAQQPGSLQRVRWWVQDGTLYRAVAPARGRYPLPAPKDRIAVLGQVLEARIRVWETDKGWRLLSGNRKEQPAGIEIRLARQTPQGIERYSQVLGPLDQSPVPDRTAITQAN